MWTRASDDFVAQGETMRNVKALTAVMLTAMLSLAPLAAFAAGADQTSTKKPAATKSTEPKSSTASHTASGTVKSMTTDSLVITGKDHKDMTFALNSSTQKAGNPDVGSKVSVRYKQEGGQMVATAVNAQGKSNTAKK
jgi:hypothetical protein